MKRIMIALVLAGFVSVGILGCGESTTTTSTTHPSGATTSTTK